MLGRQRQLLVPLLRTGLERLALQGTKDKDKWYIRYAAVYTLFYLFILSTPSFFVQLRNSNRCPFSYRDFRFFERRNPELFRHVFANPGLGGLTEKLEEVPEAS